MKSGLRRSVPYLNFWTSQSCFLSSNWFSKCEHWYTDKPLVITKARCTRVLNFITATSRICSIKIISYMYTVCEKGASKWKGLLVWLATLQWLQHTCTCFRMTFLLILGCGRHRLWDFWHIPYLPTSFPGFSLTYPYGQRERETLVGSQVTCLRNRVVRKFWSRRLSCQCKRPALEVQASRGIWGYAARENFYI